MVLRSILIAVLCIAACGGKPSPPPTVENVAPPDPVATPAPAPKSEMEVALAKMEEFANAMCGCLDKVCADAVQERMTLWSTEMATKYRSKEEAKPTEAAMKRMTAFGTKYTECVTKAMTATP